MTINEREFHRLAGDMLASLGDALDAADQAGDVELEMQGGLLTLGASGGQQLLLSKHAPTRQIWLASPVSGGLHFSYDGSGWVLADGRDLRSILAAELKQLFGLEIAL